MGGRSDELRLVPDWKLLVDGQALPPLEDAQLLRAVVDLDVDLFGSCALTFHDPELALINGARFACGSSVQVTSGFGHDQKTVFRGEVVALEPQFRRDTLALRVVCYEAVHRLALETKTRSFNAVDDKQVVTAIAQEHGLSADAPSGSQEHVLQSNVSDALFLRRLAQKQGNHVRIEGKKLVVGPPPKGAQLTIGPADGVKRIRVRIEAGAQVGEVTIHGWDPKTKKEFVGKAKAPPGDIGKGSRDHGGGTSVAFAAHEYPPADMATAQAMAEGRMRKLAEHFVTATVEMIGNAAVVPGAEITFEKMGEKLDGTYRVNSATHQFSKHGYLVRFAAALVARPPPPRAPAPPPPTTWLELELVGDDGKPRAGERYKVTTPDGQQIEGFLDSNGRARIAGLRQGSCAVTYPDLGESWEKTT